MHDAVEASKPDDDTRWYDEATKTVNEREIQLSEAADMYGDLETAEDYGYVTRG